MLYTIVLNKCTSFIDHCAISLTTNTTRFEGSHFTNIISIHKKKKIEPQRDKKKKKSDQIVLRSMINSSKA